MSIEDALAKIPGIAGYEGSRSLNDRLALSNIQQVSGIAALQDVFRKQALEQQFRGELSQAKTPEEQMAVAVKYGGPKDILTHADTQARIRATQEQAMARLAQTAQQFNARLETVKDENLRKRLKDQFDQYATRQLMAIRGAKAAYELPPDLLPSIVGQQPPAMVPGAPTPATAGGIPTAAQAEANIPPSDLAAFRIAQSGLGHGGATASAQRQVSPQEEGGMAIMPGTSSEFVAPTPPAPLGVTYPDEANLDVRDLRSRQAPPAAAHVATGAPAPLSAQPDKTALPPMPPEIARGSRKMQDQWIAQQTKASISGAGVLNPRTLDTIADQYLAGDRQAVSGYARSTTARIALANAIAEKAAARGMSGQQIAAKMADYAGLTAASRSVGQRTATLSMAANEASDMINIVRDTSQKFARSDFVPFNQALKAYETNTGAPEVKEFGAAINALVNVYARAISPSGVPTVNDKEHARELLAAVDSPAQVEGVLKIIGKELEIAKRAPASAREAIRAEITGTPSPTPKPAPTQKNVRQQADEILNGKR